jgi:hypothetical protein
MSDNDEDLDDSFEISSSMISPQDVLHARSKINREEIKECNDKHKRGTCGRVSAGN